MAEEFVIKRNDTSPSILYQLELQSGQSLAGALVRFHMADVDGGVVVDADGAVHSESLEQIRYDWIAADTASAGAYRAEFEVTFQGGQIETFPNDPDDPYIVVKIPEDLA